MAIAITFSGEVQQHFLCKILKVIVYSVTRFGEISPLWQIIKHLWQYISGLFGFGQSFQLTLAQFVCHWAHFQCWKWPNIENTIWSSGHTDGVGVNVYNLTRQYKMQSMELISYFLLQSMSITATRVIVGAWYDLK